MQTPDDDLTTIWLTLDEDLDEDLDDDLDDELNDDLDDDLDDDLKTPLRRFANSYTTIRFGRRRANRRRGVCKSSWGVLLKVEVEIGIEIGNRNWGRNWGSELGSELGSCVLLYKWNERPKCNDTNEKQA